MALLRKTQCVAPVWSPYLMPEQVTTSPELTSTEASTPATEATEATAPAETEAFPEPVSVGSASPIPEVQHGPGRYYCAPCTSAKALQGYNQRVKSLLKMMHCAAASITTGSSSPHSHRYADYWGRRGKQCIAREGYISLCDHVDLTFADLTGESPGTCEYYSNELRWRKYVSVSRNYDGELEIECRHGDHRKPAGETYRASCPDAPSATRRRAGPLFVWDFHWSSRIRTDRSEESWNNMMQTSTSRAIAAVRQRQFAFCPHFGTTVHRLSQPSRDNIVSCRQCSSTVTHGVLTPRGYPLVTFTSTISLRKEDPALQPEWLWRLDPGSCCRYDPDTEHITWCRDLECATTYELCRAS